MMLRNTPSSVCPSPLFVDWPLICYNSCIAWILKDYTSENLNLASPSSYREFVLSSYLLDPSYSPDVM